MDRILRLIVKIILSWLSRTYPIGAVLLYLAIVASTITWIGHIPDAELAVLQQESEEVFNLQDWLEFIVPRIEAGYGT